MRPSEIEIKNMFEKLTEPDDEDDNDVTAESLVEKITEYDSSQNKDLRGRPKPEAVRCVVLHHCVATTQLFFSAMINK